MSETYTGRLANLLGKRNCRKLPPTYSNGGKLSGRVYKQKYLPIEYIQFRDIFNPESVVVTPTSRNSYFINA